MVIINHFDNYIQISVFYLFSNVRTLLFSFRDFFSIIKTYDFKNFKTSNIFISEKIKKINYISLFIK